MTSHIAITIVLSYSPKCDVRFSLWCQLKEYKGEKFGNTTPYMTEVPRPYSLAIAGLPKM